MKKIISVSLVLLLISVVSVMAEKNIFTVKGYIYNSETKEPVDNVNVFLEGTTRGSATDINGYFIIDEVTEGHYVLVAQHIAYKLFITNLSTYKDDQLKLEISLDPQIILADSVQVVAPTPTSWRKHSKIFKKEFIGKSFNSRKCKLLNPEVVEFRKSVKGDTLYAYTDSILRVENRSLGYMLHIILDEFRCVHNKLDFYKIYPHFKLLKIKKLSEQNYWIAQRKKTYQGSLRHFLKSVVSGTTNQEGFNWIYTAQNNIKLTQQLLETESGTDLNIVHYRTSNLTGFTFSHYLMVAHKGNFQLHSWSVLKLKSSMTFIDKNGSLLRPEELLIEGKWYKNRVCDMLPSDYKP